VASATAMPTNAKAVGGGAAGNHLLTKSPYMAPLSAPSNNTGVK